MDNTQELKDMIGTLIQYIPTGTVECRGDKCREMHCISCFGDEIAFDAIEDNMQLITKARELL